MVGDSDVEEAVFLIFHGVFAPLGLGVVKLVQLKAGAVTGHHMGDFFGTEFIAADILRIKTDLNKNAQQYARVVEHAVELAANFRAVYPHFPRPAIFIFAYGDVIAASAEWRPHQRRGRNLSAIGEAISNNWHIKHT